MNRMILCTSTLLILIMPQFSRGQSGGPPPGSCDYTMTVSSFEVLRPGNSINWPIHFTHIWGDPAVGAWPVTKSGCPTITFTLDNGTFSVSSGGSQTTAITVTASSDTCAQDDAYATADSSACGKSKTATSEICIVPDGETTKCIREWNLTLGDPIGDGAQFRVRLDPQSADFSRRVVTEIFDNCSDGCICGNLPSFLRPAVGDSWTIVANNQYNCFDSIGYRGNVPASRIIMDSGNAPCENHAIQQMWITCDNGYMYNYESHTVSWSIDKDGYWFVERDGVTGGPYACTH